jgi:hypothetical protein
MGKISTYSIDALPTLQDKVIGSDADDSLVTKNYLLSDIIGLVETPNLQEVLDAGNIATQNIFLKGVVDTERLNVGVSASFAGTAEFTNNVLFDFGYIELQGGVKDSTGNYGTAGQFLQTDGSLVRWVTPPPFPADLQSVLDTGNTAKQDINLSGNINLQGNLVQSVGNTQLIDLVVKGKSIFENAAEFQTEIIALGPILDNGGNPGTSGQVLVSAGNAVKWVDNVVVNQPTFSKVLEASSFVDQLPTGQNSPLQVEFGANQQTPEINLLPTGEVNFLVDGTYFFEAFGNVERNGNSGGVAMVMYRILLNGNQIGITRGVDINSVGIMIPLAISEPIKVNAGDVLTFEILRDANGVNQGGLYTHQIAGGVWPTVPSASISVWKLT